MTKILIRKRILLAVIMLAIATIAAYSGPNRTITVTEWERQSCDYHASYDPVGPGYYDCDLTLYFAPSGCPAPSSVAGYFNNNPYACGASWPGSCTTLPCSISLVGSRTETCDPGDVGCQETTTTTTLPPATVSGSVYCATPGANGYCRSIAALNLTANEPVAGWTITGIESNLGMLCTTNTASPSCSWNFPQGDTTITYWALSSHGDTSLSATSSAKVDSVPPTVVANITGTLGLNGWYVSLPSITAVGSDATSGIFTNEVSLNGGTYTTTVNVATDGTHTYRARAMDNAGNVTYNATQTIKVDTTAPTQAVNVSGTAGTGGWYVSPVTVSVTASDATSGVAYSQYRINGGAWVNGTSVIINTAAGSTVTFRTYDNAGNVSGLVSTPAPIRVDTNMPTVSLVPSGTLGLNGWYVSNANVAVSITDAESGLSTARYRSDGGAWINGTSATLTFSDGTHTADGEAADAAGNTASASVTVNVDTTAPSQALAISGTPGANGWYVSAVTVTASTSDSTSGVDFTQYRVNGGAWITGASYTSSADGNYTVDFRTYDKAGNVSAISSRTFSVDTTAPAASSALTGTAGANGWYISPVNVLITSSDAISGVGQVEYRLDGSSWATGNTLTVSTSGSHLLDVRVTDNAGNVTMLAPRGILVDLVNPAIATAITGTTGANGWYVSSVTATATASDTTSGIDLVEYQVNNGAWITGASYSPAADGTYTVVFRALDKAGRSSISTSTFKVDSTKPAAAMTITGVPGLANWLIADAKANISASDAGSGIDKIQYRINGGQWIDGNAPALSDGVSYVEARISDLAGNIVLLPGQVANVDTKLPSGTVTNAIQPGANGWYTANVPITLTNPSDATSGVLLVEYNLDGEWRTGMTVTITQEGTHSAFFRVTDKAGNRWDSPAQVIKLDKTAPALTISTPAGSEVLRGETVISGVASDNLAGLDNVQISLDGGKTWQTAILVGTTWKLPWDTRGLPNGNASVLVRAIDQAGNVSQPQTVAVILANEGPKVDVENSWWLWQEGYIRIEGIEGTPLDDMTIHIDCREPLPDVEIYFPDPEDFPKAFWWDGRCGNTEPAEGGEYPITVTTCDIYGNCASDTGMIKIASVSLPLVVPTWTPTAIATAAPTATPTVNPTSKPSDPTPTAIVIPQSTPTPTPIVAEEVAYNLSAALVAALLLFAAIGSSSAIDPRPKALTRLRRTLEGIHEYQKENRQE